MKVTDLWEAAQPTAAAGPSSRLMSLAQAEEDITMKLLPDKTAGGGVGVVLVTPA